MVEPANKRLCLLEAHGYIPERSQRVQGENAFIKCFRQFFNVLLNLASRPLMRMRWECLIIFSPKVWDADIINPNPGYGNKYVNNVTSVEVD